MTTVNRARLVQQLELEQQRFSDLHPTSHELFRRAQKSLLAGVPMSWMVKWAGSFPVFVTGGKGAHFTDVDGREYIDLCLGDTGAMTGHAPDVVLMSAPFPGNVYGAFRIAQVIKAQDPTSARWNASSRDQSPALTRCPFSSSGMCLPE